MLMLLTIALLAHAAPQPTSGVSGPPGVLPEVVIDRDNVVVTESCRVVISEGTHIPDTDNNGVIHVGASGITLEFADAPHAALRAAPVARDYETITGIGIRIEGHDDVTIRGARVHRYKQAIWATNADNLTIEGCDVSEGYAMRLGSTPAAEDSADWLWPHDNDQNQWATNYGAGIWIEDSTNVTVRDCVARTRQNALILENVTDSRIYDNDFSFLSGWGLAMWRSSGNTISRNALDFCIRGYSHGVYNRGQDSAGILLFEQCSDNFFLANSVTHGGDGVFGFGGKEALGDTPAPETDADGNPWTYERKGCNDNTFIGNDLSYAAAHGLELTFSFGNTIALNRFVENAICGIWGGYSQDTSIDNNVFTGNGDAGYGLERGGINIEHSERNLILSNRFSNNAAGVHLWHDADSGLMSGKWAAANHQHTRDNAIEGNEFRGDAVGIHLRAVHNTFASANEFIDVVTPVLADVPNADGTSSLPQDDAPPVRIDRHAVSFPRHHFGDRQPVGARPNLACRHNIIMGRYFPWDHESPMLRRGPDQDGSHVYELLGVTDPGLVKADISNGTLQIVSVASTAPLPSTAASDLNPAGPPRILLVVSPEPDSDVTAYTLILTAPIPASVPGVIVRTAWEVRSFHSPVDPRQDLDAWRAAVNEGIRSRSLSIDFQFGHHGPSNLRPPGLDIEETRDAAPGSNHFGTIATTTLRLPPGRWRITTLSDDGIRVIVNDQVILENWTHHGPTRDAAEFDVPVRLTADGNPVPAPPTEITVEHFELDGYAVLELKIEPVAPVPDTP